FELQTEFEVLEFPLGDDVDAALAVRHRIPLDAPTPFPLIGTQPPTREVFAVEKLDRGAPLRLGFRFERRRANAGPFERRAVFAVGRGFELSAGQFPVEDQIDFHLLVLWRQAEFEGPVLEFDLLDGTRASEPPDEATLQGASGIRYLKPRRIRRVRA